jgi:hypothetical protein
MGIMNFIRGYAQITTHSEFFASKYANYMLSVGEENKLRDKGSSADNDYEEDQRGFAK